MSCVRITPGSPRKKQIGMEARIFKIKPYEKLKETFDTIRGNDFIIMFECVRWSVNAVKSIMEDASKDYNFSYSITQIKKNDIDVLLKIFCHREKSINKSHV